MYWHIGKLINDEILQNKRAEYGKEIVVTLSRQLSWSHFLALLPLQDALKIEFYAHTKGISPTNLRLFNR